ncbi:HK97 family phage portal protein [Algoriphagus sp. 4150]|uniref:phage portal protein n=1 Tax=Algoriphagus sp. 4150 TaxID=2817756 RepID=UPI00286238D0|nr:phage portal protein [Algoriphagus sp. 4150]MDR7130696.1 HK97 family phage portal protein [Algoriphagus sp. 4150]
MINQLRSIFGLPSLIVPNVISIDSLPNSIAVNSNSALSISSFYQGVNVIANSVASMPLKIYQNKKVYKEHPAYFLLKERPNFYQSSFEWLNTMLFIMLIKGNSFSKIVRDSAGNPVDLKIISFTYVEAIFFNEKLYFKFDGDEGKVIENDDLIHFKNIGSGFLGIDPINNFRKNLEINLNSVDYTNKIYNGEGGSIRGTIQYDKELNDKQRDRLRGELTNNFSGQNGKRILFLEDGMKLNQIELDPSQTKFLESRRFEKEEICSMLNLPLFILNAEVSSTNQNIEFNNIRFYQITLLPLITKIESELKFKLFSKKEIIDGVYPKFSIDGVLRGDSKARGELYKSLFYLGAISPEEIRELEDMPEEINGDTYIQANLIPKSIVNRFWDSKAKLDYSKSDLNEVELQNFNTNE